MPERRAYPRIASDLAGALEFKVTSAASKSSPAIQRLQVPVGVSSLSREGAAVYWLAEPPTADLPSRRVTLHLAIGPRNHQVPAMVAWATYPDPDGVARLGLRLELAASSAATRIAFTEWIAEQTRAGRAEANRARYSRQRPSRTDSNSS